jgi:photosystem II stability/assembly factor-like uncharacterized protein
MRSPAARPVPSVAVLLLLFVLSLSGAAHAETGVQIRDNLYATAFISAEEGWVVGAFGSVYHTSDGGKTWESQPSGTLEHLFGVDFVDSHSGWVVGRSGVIGHSEDGGTSWSRQKAGNERHLFSVAAITTRRAAAIGDWGQIWMTEDGGETWLDRSLPRDVILNGQSWPDAEHGWVVGEMGAIVVTRDGGRTWTEQDSGVMKTLFAVQFKDLREGWVVGIDGLILHTTDGGESWEAQRGDVTLGALEHVGFAQAMGNASLYDVVVAGDYGYAVGDVGTVLVSTDGGQSWEPADVPAEAGMRWIRSVALIRGTHGLLVGAEGLTVRINDKQLQLP